MYSEISSNKWKSVLLFIGFFIFIGIIVFALTSLIVIALIPVIGPILALIAILIVSGYTFEVAVKSSKGDSSLPKFSNPVGLLVRGIKVVMAELIYLLPGIVVSAIGAASAILIVFTKILEAGGSVSDPAQLWQILAPALASGGIIILPGFLLIFIGWVLWTSKWRSLAMGGPQWTTWHPSMCIWRCWSCTGTPRSASSSSSRSASSP